MNTLANVSFTDLLQRLFAETEASVLGGSPALADPSEAELKRLAGSKVEYYELYGHLKDLIPSVSREAGNLLYMLARNSSTRSIVEFGTSFSLSTLHLVAALRGNSGDRLIGSKFEPFKTEQVRRNLATGGLLDLVKLREGDALQTLAKDLPDSIDLVLLDGAKVLYPEILVLLESHLRPDALVIANSAEHNPEYLAHIRSPANGYLSTPFVEDVELSIRLG